jgi:hypothetical protein
MSCLREETDQEPQNCQSNATLYITSGVDNNSKGDMIRFKYKFRNRPLGALIPCFRGEQYYVENGIDFLTWKKATEKRKNDFLACYATAVSSFLKNKAQDVEQNKSAELVSLLF